MTVAAKFTICEYHQMIEAGILVNRQVELMNGTIVEMPPEGVEHSSYSWNLADHLRDLIKGRALVREGKPITLVVSNSEAQPDIAIIREPRSLYLEHHPYPEDIYWLIEVSKSTLAFDTGDSTIDKPSLYASAGIREYWVVDVDSKKLIVYRNPEEGKYRQRLDLLETAKISPLAFPDIELAIVSIFRLD